MNFKKYRSDKAFLLAQSQRLEGFCQKLRKDSKASSKANKRTLLRLTKTNLFRYKTIKVLFSCSVNLILVSNLSTQQNLWLSLTMASESRSRTCQLSLIKTTARTTQSQHPYTWTCHSRTKLSR
jgi:hypothetical protein